MVILYILVYISQVKQPTFLYNCFSNGTKDISRRNELDVQFTLAQNYLQYFKLSKSFASQKSRISIDYISKIVTGSFRCSVLE